MVGASPLLYVTVQRLASVCMSFSSFVSLLWLTRRRFGCLSSCWSLRLGFLSHYISICLHPEVELNYTSVRLCADNNAWTCSAIAKVKVDERVDAEDEGTLKTEPTRPRQLDKLITWLFAYYRTLSDITYPNLVHCWHTVVLVGEVLIEKQTLVGELIVGHNIWAGVLLYSISCWR